MRVYIAGPMRGYTLFNFPMFDLYADELEKHGHTPVSPADIDRLNGFNPESLPEDYDWNQIPEGAGTRAEIIARDIEALQTCDAICLLPDWKNSVGARAEAAMAHWMGLKLVNELGDEVGDPENQQPIKAVKDSNPKDDVGSRKPGIGAVPCKPLYEAGAALTYGGKKYGNHNYRHIGVRASVYYDAAMRHLMAWWEGEDIDPIEKGGSGLPHLAHAIAGLMVYRDAELAGMVTDDRPIATGSPYAHLEPIIADICDRYPNPVKPYTEASHGRQERVSQLQ